MKKKGRIVRLLLILVGCSSLPLLYLLFGLFRLSSRPPPITNPPPLLYRDQDATTATGLMIHRSNRIGMLEHPNPKSYGAENKLKQVPDFIIAGTQKGGTTALRAILVQHPNMIASKQFEPHYFDKTLLQYLQKQYNATTNDIQPSWMDDIQRHYRESTFHPRALAQAAEAGMFFFEKTPSYLVDPDVPSLISMICRWNPKIIVMLRNPVDRAYSHYKMEREKLRVKGRDFESVVTDEMAAMRSLGLTTAPLLPIQNSSNGPSTDLNWKQFVGLLSEQQFHPPTLDAATSDKAHKKLLLDFRNTNFLQRGMYSVQIQRWLQYFTLNNSLLVLKFEDLQANPASIYQEILNFLGAPDFDLMPEDFLKAYRTRGQYRRKGMFHQPLSNETKRYLEMFYEPYNKILQEIVGRQFYSSIND